MPPPIDDNRVFSDPDDHLEAAKTQLVDALDRFERPLVAYATRLLQGDEDRARDAVQHTFLQLCRQPAGSVDHKLAPWLYTVCRNRALDEIRGLKRMTSDEHLNRREDSAAADPAVIAEQADFLVWLRKQMDRLREAEREVIDLWSHGLKTAEIADILGKSRGSVRVYLHRAIKALRQDPQIAKWLERATGHESNSNEAIHGSESHAFSLNKTAISGERS